MNELTENEVLEIIEEESYLYDGLSDLLEMSNSREVDIYSKVKGRGLSNRIDLLSYIRKELLIELDLMNDIWLTTVIIEKTGVKVTNVPLSYWGGGLEYDLGDPHWLISLLSDEDVIKDGRADYLEYTNAKNGMIDLYTHPRNTKVKVII